MEMKKMGLHDIRFTIVCPSYVSTGMFSGAKPPIFTPWMTPEKMAKKIYRAMKKNRNYLLEPAGVKLAPLMKAIVATPLLDRYNLKLGIAKSMNGWTGRKEG
jgi:short-subunit dehydrogenase